MRRTLLLAACGLVGTQAWAGGPEAERFAAERLFLGLPGRLPELRGASIPEVEGAEVEAAPVPEAGAAAVRAAPPLDFSGVTWPSSFSNDDRKAISIALDISGSYEGDDGWDNITGNFDGQGLSLGLLNQCLGQGSLQPLLIRLRDEHPDRLQALFSPEHLKSLLSMLSQWESASKAGPAATALSTLDEVTAAVRLSPANQASVDWAKKNLFDGSAFKPEWRKELTALASSPEYVSNQIDAARDIHAKALALQARIKIREFRAYLLFFDLVVQNGGVYDEDWNDYDAWLRKNPKASSTKRLQKILELRLRHVRKQYVDDVRRRKSAIINGTGTVHGEARNLPKEYSYDPLWTYT